MAADVTVHVMEKLERNRKVLQEATTLLCDYLLPGRIIRKLKGNRVFEVDEVEDIRSRPCTEDKVERMLEILQKKDCKAYDNFIDALKAEREDLYNKVKSIETRLAKEHCKPQVATVDTSQPKGKDSKDFSEHHKLPEKPKPATVYTDQPRGERSIDLSEIHEQSDQSKPATVPESQPAGEDSKNLSKHQKSKPASVHTTQHGEKDSKDVSEHHKASDKPTKLATVYLRQTSREYSKDLSGSSSSQENTGPKPESEKLAVNTSNKETSYSINMSTESTTPPISFHLSSKSRPPGITTVPNKGVKIVFHTIIPPEFSFNEHEYVAAVHMGGTGFGNFNIDCLEMRVVRELPGGYIELRGDARFKCSYLDMNKNGVPYRYCIYPKKGRSIEYDYEYVDRGEPIPGAWARCLKVPPEFCANNVWHQYDCVMELNKQKRTSTKPVMDRKILAFKTYLPNWKGFVTTNGREMNPTEARVQLDRVCDSLSKAKVMQGTQRKPTPKTPGAFKLPQLLLDSLSEKIASYSQGTDADPETRLKSALVILLLMKDYKVELSSELESSLLEGCRFPRYGENQTKLATSLIQSFKKDFSQYTKHIIEILEQRCAKFLTNGDSKFLLALPLLHFLREECKPYETILKVADAERREAHLFNSWWGVDNLIKSQTQRDLKDLRSVILQLVPELEADVLLRRSLIWLQLTPMSLLPSMQNDQEVFCQFPPELLIRAFHVIVTRMSCLKDKSVAENLTKWIQMLLTDQPCINFIKRLEENKAKKLAFVTIHIANSLIEIEVAAKKARNEKHHQFIVGSCRLFAECYNKSQSHTSKQFSLTSSEEFGWANSLMHRLTEWLKKYLPVKLTKDGKELIFSDEFQIWSDLFEMGELIAGLEWNQNWTRMLSERVNQLDSNVKMDLFRMDMSKYHTDVSKVASEAVFQSIDDILKGNAQVVQTWFQRWWSSSKSAKEKNAKLLSEVLCQKWPSQEIATDEAILRHLLTWSPIADFLKLKESADHMKALSDTAKEHLTNAHDILETTYNEVISGDIMVRKFKLVTQEQCYKQFIELFSLLKPTIRDVREVGQVGESQEPVNLNRLLEMRKDEITQFKMHQKLNENLVRVCERTDIDIDTSDVKAKLQQATDEKLTLKEVCKPITFGDLQKSPQGSLPEPHIIFFEHPDVVQEMLNPLLHSESSVIFGNLWNDEALTIKERKQDQLTIEDVENQLWKPVFEENLQPIYRSVRSAEIKLEDVDSLFSDLKTPGSLKREISTLSNLYGDQDQSWVEERTNQIINYRTVQLQSEMAIQMLTMQDAFKLKGDFKALETLSQMGLPSFKCQPLNFIVESVVKASQTVAQVNGKKLRCLEEAAKAPEFIKWIQKEIQDVHQLKVFVDMAMIQAGETDLEIDRVSCFHSAAMGYAPIIFDLNEDSNCQDLLDSCAKVWAALDNDPELPLKLRDAKKYIHWLREVQVQQHGGETSSVSQLETINSRGTYIVGKLLKRTTQMKGRNLQGANLVLTVKGAKSRGMTISTDDKVYTVAELQDLQGKLNLVMGKKQKEEGKAQIDNFIEVFTAAQQLADSYDKLCKAGCLLFSKWKVTLFSQPLGKVSIHVDFGVGNTKLLAGTKPLREELDSLREFMKTCLDDWQEYMDIERSRAYHLNYFTTEQLVLLRQALAVFRQDGKKCLEPQVYALLYSLKSACSQEEVESAVTAVIGPPKQMQASPPASAKVEKETPKKEMTPEEKAQQKIASKLKEQKFLEIVINASFKELGQGKPLKDYKRWMNQNEDKVTEAVTARKETEQDMKEALLTDAKLQESTLKGQLNKLWDDYIHTMKLSDLEDCLSLRHVGKILEILAYKETSYPKREIPSYLKESQPNLIVRSSGQIIPTLLSIYKECNGALPSLEEILMCSKQTTYEQVEIFWRRAIDDSLGRVFCLVRADLLDYSVSVEAEKKLHELMREKQGYRLTVLCSSEQDESSHIVTALDTYRVDNPRCQPEEIRHYLKEKLQEEVQATNTVNAAKIAPHSGTVEVVLSNRPGVGKSLQVRRHVEELRKHLLKEKQNILEPICVRVPLHEAYVKEDDIVAMLLPHQMASYGTSPRIFHIDVAPMVRHGLDPFLFMLLVAGGVCDTKGRLWRRHPQDLYVIEITELKVVGSTGNRDSVPFHDLLPNVACHAPVDVLKEIPIQPEESEWQPFDPRVDQTELESSTFQIVYQYLTRSDKRQNLDNFSFKHGSKEGSPQQFLETLSRHCGIPDPSWTELRHFAKFLSVQLRDCQELVFTSGTGMAGFKEFIVRFLIQMSGDFVTPSLELRQEEKKAGVEDDEDDDNGNRQQQLMVHNRKWEKRPHPYVFFTEDHSSMTFLGVYIDDAGQVVSSTTREPIEDRDKRLTMSKQLRDSLKAHGFDLDFCDFNLLGRKQKLRKLRLALGTKDDYDPDKTYELTADNMQKILAINMKFRCGIPVVVMGETGCGKTRLISFLCRLKAGPPKTDEDKKNKSPKNMLLMKVHGGTTVDDVIKKVHVAEQIAEENKEKYNLDTILFFDEANTTEAVGLIKEIMSDQRILGKHMNMANGALKIIAACNPYRRHDTETIKRLKSAGLGYNVSLKDVREKLGAIPLRELVYRVHSLPPSVTPLVWDFGQLSDDVEGLYIRQIVQRYVNDEDLKVTPVKAQIITNVLSQSQRFMREQKTECSFVSLRDVERSLDVLTWFENQPLLSRLLDERFQEVSQKTQQTALDRVTRALLLAVGVCYHASLHESRANYREVIAKQFQPPCELHGGPDRILDEISRCQDVFLDEVELEPYIARNNALKENVFMMVVCIELRIPLFLVGKPGSSKSLAKTIISKAMQGEAAGSELFRSMKQVHMISYQCSPLSTPEGIVGTFRQCSRFQEGRDLKHFVSVVVLDEIGLAEDSQKMPLKSLHPLLETGSDEDELDVPKHKKVAFIGISNWSLDPAKMNRGIGVCRDEPDEKELIKTARGICSMDKVALQLIEPRIPTIAKAYLEMYLNQEKHFFGLRDYYSLIKMIFSFALKFGQQPTQADIEHAVRRNFGGLMGTHDPMKVFRDELQFEHNLEQQKETSVDLLKSSLHSKSTPYDEGRYLLVLTENTNATLPILQQQLLREFDANVIFGSSFPFDQEYTQVCRDINRIKRVMEAGKTVVLLNMENLYESLYDALNQYYVQFGGNRYVDLGLGTSRFKCRVDKDFRLIVVADKDVVHKRFPTPLLNRLEKHFLATASMLTDAEKKIEQDLNEWLTNFASVDMPYQGKRSKIQKSDAFVGFNDDMIAALVFQVCLDLQKHHGDETWRKEVYNRVECMLLQCATPEAVIRVRKSSALSHQAGTLFYRYFTEQHHRCLQEYLQDRLQDKTKDAMVQVTTHSRLLVRDDFPKLAKALNVPETDLHVELLQTFQTQMQFCNKIREVFDKCREKEHILMIQCGDGDENNDLIVCAFYCVQDEKMQAQQAALDAGFTLKPAHVVFVIQLPRVQKGFLGFQGGTWDFTHIDDLKLAEPNRPVIADLKGRSVGSLLKKDEPPVISSTMLMRDCLLDAVSHVRDNEQCTHLGKPRRNRLRQFLETDADLTKGELNFLRVAKERLAELLDDMDTYKNNNGDAWLTSEALAVTEAHRGGTFRRAIWYRLIAIVSPLAAELYAFCDYNENLSLLENHPENSWQHQVWLAIFEDSSLSPIHYKDFLSPKDEIMRDSAPVKVLGAGERHFAAKIPFSWVLKDYMEDKYREAVERKTTTQQPVAKSYMKQVKDSPWDKFLSQVDLLQAEVYEQFVKDYMEDFIKMMYRFRAKETLQDHELECAGLEFLTATRETAGQLEIEMFANIMETLVALHLAYHRIKGILYNFARLVETCPVVMEAQQQKNLTKLQNDMTLDVKVLILVVEILKPGNTDLEQGNHLEWLNRGNAAKPIIDNVIEAVVCGSKDAYHYGELSENDFDETRKAWLKVSLLILFFERVCSTPDVDPCLFESAKELWEELDIEEPVLQSYKDLKDLEASLQTCSKQASTSFFGYEYDTKCPVCEESLHTPSKLPCGHFVCDPVEGTRCLSTWIENNGHKCPSCNDPIPEDFTPDEEIKAAKRKFTSFKKNVNAFFLDVVSLLCFMYNKPPDDQIIRRLLAIVTKFAEEDSLQYESDIIDPDPVARSAVLQLLLQTSREMVEEYLDNYLKKMQKVLVHRSPEELQEVSFLFIQCLENHLYQTAFKDAKSEEPLVNSATLNLKESCHWLREKDVEQGLSVKFLSILASARFGIAITAQCLHKISSEESEDPKLHKLFDEAKQFVTTHREGLSFLVRQLCHSYGTTLYTTLIQNEHLKSWIAPQSLQDWTEDPRDNYVVCGDLYNSIREAMARDLIKVQFKDVPTAIQTSKQDQSAEVALLLSLYREVTSQYSTSNGFLDPMKTNFMKFVQNTEGLLQKEFAAHIQPLGEHLVLNEIGESDFKHLEVTCNQSPTERMLAALVVHTMAVLRCEKLPDLLKPLTQLLLKPNTMANEFLPTMTGDPSSAVCPRGHIYNVGNSVTTCPECGSPVGGENDDDKQRFTGHVLGIATNRSATALPESQQLPSTVMAVVRAILHATMIASTVESNKAAKEINQLIHPTIDYKETADFLWSHLSVDIGQLSTACGKSQEDCFLILHMVLNNMISLQPARQIKPEWINLGDSDAREQWEIAFSEAFISPVLKNLTDLLLEASDLLQKDERFKNNPVNRILFRQDMEEVTREKMCNLHTLPIMWQYWPRISIVGVQQYLDQIDTDNIINPNAKGPYAVLRAFLRKEHILQLVRHIPDIIQLHQLLIDRYNRRVDANEAGKMTIEEFLGELQELGKEHYHEEMKRLVIVFIEAWNSVRDNVAGHGGVQVPNKLCSKPLDMTAPLAVLLPTRNPPGICSTALAGFLIRAHNDFLATYDDIKERESTGNALKASDATQSHLVAFHPDRELLPLILAHSMYKTEADKGTELTYDLMGIQKHVEDRFIVGRPQLLEKIEQLSFRQDSRNTETFRRIRRKIKQKSLSDSVQQGILSDFSNSYENLCDSVDTLDIAIGFVESTDCKCDMYLREYLVDELALPKERGIRSPKAEENCYLENILALWHLLAVERAKKMASFGQNPFEGIQDDFCQTLPEQVKQGDSTDQQKTDGDLKKRLFDALKYIKVERFIAELYEFVILELKGSTSEDQIMKERSLGKPLQDYIKEKGGEEIRGLMEHIPHEIQLQHAVDTWMVAANYIAQPKAQHKSSAAE